MGYTDLTTEFDFKDLLTWQNMDALGENDAYLKTLLGGYRRPILAYISATAVDVENNTGTANETKIMFPDGTSRSVTENTGSTNKYRRFDITATAEFTTGTEDSGLRSGLSEANNTWYAIYAVKSTINSANFILAGDTTLPIQANFATLNTRYGTNGWLYLGMIRNGDNSGTAGDILAFLMGSNRTLFYNTATGNAFTSPGIRVASTAGATTLTYTYAAGTGAAQIPNHITAVIYQANFAVSAGDNGKVKDSSGTRFWHSSILTGEGGIFRVEVPASEGVNLSNTGGASIAQDVFLGGIIDPILALGTNPTL